MIWERDTGTLHARQPYLFRFRVEDAAGWPAPDMELYMGMLGHAAFVRRDRAVFAHIHPPGSLPAEISFPDGFPKPGDYRIFVQVKHGGQIETGIFDAHVEN
jgi:hypothetical protein